MPQTIRVKYRGTAFEFGEDNYILPPLILTELEEHSVLLDAINKRFEQLDEKGEPKPVKTGEAAKFIRENVLPVFKSALLRNYPNLDKDILNTFVTTRNWMEILSALFGNSTAKQVKDVGEADPVE